MHGASIPSSALFLHFLTAASVLLLTRWLRMLECSASLASPSRLFHLQPPILCSTIAIFVPGFKSSFGFPSSCTAKSRRNGVCCPAPKRHSSCSRRRSFSVCSMSGEDNRDSEANAAAQAQADADIEAIEARLRIGRRGRKRQKGGDGVQAGKSEDSPKRSKSWEEMTLPEKAWELYAGEKGFLFWLNKLAYASIFVLAGGWIVFRFIGPALGLYQLDSPLLPPDQAFTRP